MSSITLQPSNIINQTLTPVSSSFPSSLLPVLKEVMQVKENIPATLSSKIPVISIGGCPGVGKTHITRLFSQELTERGLSCVVIHFDDWTNPAENRQNGYFNLQGIHEFFQALLSGTRVINKPTSAEFVDEYGQETLDLRKTDIVLFEGLSALSAKDPINYFSYCDFGIFVDAPREDITHWKRTRPCTVPRTDEEFAQHMVAVFGYHEENIEPFKKNANWVIEKDRSHNYFPKQNSAQSM